MQPNRMLLAHVALYALITLPAHGYWRMPCMGVAGIGRIDPVVAPNETSAHMHTIKGSSGTSPSATTDDLLNADCTSCQIAQDKSAYWTPQMYFFDTDKNAFEEVPEVQGHITYYKYVPAFISNGSYINPIAVPNGMKMLSGNTYRRNFTLPVPDPPLPWHGDDATQEALQQKAVGFNCLNHLKDPPEGTLQRHFLPDKSFLETECLDGIRLEVLFPICWNGQDLTSSSQNFTSHVAYSSAGANGGNCPAGYDTVINQLLYETIYPTQKFIGRNGFYALSNGDNTGYGYHGDAFIAWEGDVQQRATELCGDPVHSYGVNGTPSECPVFNIQSTNDQASCKLNAQRVGNVNFDASGPLLALPGDNPIQSGPEEATPPSKGQAPPQSMPSSPPAATPTMSPSPSPIGEVPATSSTLAIIASSAPSPPSTAPQMTPTPSPPSPPAQDIKWSTSTYLANGAANVIIDEVFVATTVVWVDAQGSPVPAPQRRRRSHMEEHALGRRSRHQHHGR